MSRYIFSLRAEADLDDIITFTIDRWNKAQADRYLAALDDCCQRLADNPLIGRACDELLPGLRRMEQGSHVAFYRQRDYGVRIIRILHKRMLPARHITEDDED
jgi:toxin ParE1/3/4